MNRNRLVPLVASIAVAVIAAGCFASNHAGSNDREALEKTSVAIRAAFARGDVATILQYHHPNVVKALSYTKLINGRDALQADLVGTLRSSTWSGKRTGSRVC